MFKVLSTAALTAALLISLSLPAEAMNRNGLIAAVSPNSGASKADATKVVDDEFDRISAELSRGRNVNILGFGKFSVVRRTARKGRDPRTGRQINIPASRQAKFRASKVLKNAMNGRGSYGAANKQANRELQALFDTIGAELVKKNSVRVSGFGTFSTKRRSARVGRNPNTGQQVNFPASKIAIFRAIKALKDAINR